MTLRGREIYYCPDCGWFHSQKGFTGVCPKCTRPLFAVYCSRCSYQWRPKTDKLPKVCPRCKSPYWNRARVPRVPKDGANANYDERDTHDRS